MSSSEKQNYEDSKSWAMKNPEPITDGTMYLYILVGFGLFLMVLAFIFIIFGVGSTRPLTTAEAIALDPDVQQITLESSGDTESEAQTTETEYQLEDSHKPTKQQTKQPAKEKVSAGDKNTSQKTNATTKKSAQTKKGKK
jgi:hypothetical protein